MISKKDLIITIIIGIVTFILSWLCGVIFGSIILCIGTVWVYKRTKGFWKYSLITLCLNFLVAVIAGISLLCQLNILSWIPVSELEKVMAIFAIPLSYMLGIVIFLLMGLLAILRFGLQCLCCFIFKKIENRKNNK